MTRGLAGIVLTLWVGLLILLVGLRWVGQRSASTALPLPDENGCWQGVCFTALELSEVADRLNALPGVQRGTVAYIDDTTRTRVQFTYHGNSLQPRPVLLFPSPYSYSLVRDWRLPDSPSLGTLADVLAALGEPYQINMMTETVILRYPARNLQVTIIPSQIAPTWLRLAPGDPVTGLQFTDPGPAYATTRVYPPTMHWPGLGWHRFDE